MPRHTDKVRAIGSENLSQVVRLLQSSEYVYQRFTLEELPMLLATYPAVGVFVGSSLKSFLISQTVSGASAWIGGFGTNWTESHNYLRMLQVQLEALVPYLIERGTQHLHYSGNDMDQDWLRPVMLEQGFRPYCQLYAYDKYDYTVPSTGNQEVTIRPARREDIPTLLKIEEVCFKELWRYDIRSFEDIIKTHPYFVVAELHGQVVGYQFNALDGEYGYLIRIAVQPLLNSRGIGARLMAEAVDFFARARVERIMLNTEQDNTHAHHLYEWFGFIRIPQIGFVLRNSL